MLYVHKSLLFSDFSFAGDTFTCSLRRLQSFFQVYHCKTLGLLMQDSWSVSNARLLVYTNAGRWWLSVVRTHWSTTDTLMMMHTPTHDTYVVQLYSCRDSEQHKVCTARNQTTGIYNSRQWPLFYALAYQTQPLIQKWLAYRPRFLSISPKPWRCSLCHEYFASL